MRYRIELAALLLSYFRRPSNHRDWEAELAIAPVVSLSGDVISVQNVRDFRYQTPTQYTACYADRRYRLSQLVSVDMVVSYWSGAAIAHLFLSFGFSDGQYLAISIEIRRQVGQVYSSLAGFFRQYELLFVAADERDLIGQRVNARRELVYLYRLRLTPAQLQGLLLGYCGRMRQLAVRPEFYNTVTNNCTTNIFMLANAGGKLLPLSWKVLLAGYADDYAYRLGLLDQSLPFPALKAASRIDKLVAVEDAEFSQSIRAGRPGMHASS